MKALVVNCSPVRTGATAEITKIAEEQLSGRYNVKNICIDDYAFAYTNIRYFYVPKTVEVLGDKAFSYCENLEAITFGSDDQAEFLDRAKDIFEGCLALNVIRFPSFYFVRDIPNNKWKYEMN